MAIISAGQLAKRLDGSKVEIIGDKRRARMSLSIVMACLCVAFSMPAESKQNLAEVTVKQNHTKTHYLNSSLNFGLMTADNLTSIEEMVSKSSIQPMAVQSPFNSEQIFYLMSKSGLSTNAEGYQLEAIQKQVSGELYSSNVSITTEVMKQHTGWLLDKVSRKQLDLDSPLANESIKIPVYEKSASGKNKKISISALLTDDDKNGGLEAYYQMALSHFERVGHQEPHKAAEIATVLMCETRLDAKKGDFYSWHRLKERQLSTEDIATLVVESTPFNAKEILQGVANGLSTLVDLERSHSNIAAMTRYHSI
ncbi:hypothetical protein EAY39_10805 [Vibrio anguillarum]|uniref:hypothetical protein n=3 Tax=Vibrio anguillarum TaxID=55601 RepID=UPI0018C1E133|nr:hypothetical protein [Vibrio anguillarum]MBF4341272.1 hypothetical protein [Vibrio anguillarum]